ncbi:MAG: UDP-N-acetylmuramoyl-L-alanyl-D-glutamate--2,6-diaminopimelate ligase [bacterium]|nr:UDP-N-acetylmuramoyl-L-alanyl-D-glutamate--2,6-diaminopimelate ligase [bacterium]
MSLKSFLKKLFPESWFGFYHWCMAWCAAFYFGFPSRRMTVVGVTGTKGKTSTADFIWSVLTAGGYKTGLVSTAHFRIGEKEFLNPYHMTMPGRFKLQRFLRTMQKAGCTHCVIETTSEGIKQFRHKGIAYDVAVFTNLSPEHLQSHGGSFEQYKKEKGKLFALLASSPQKTICGAATPIPKTTFQHSAECWNVPKAIIVNYDDQARDYFLHFPADVKKTFGLGDGANIRAEQIRDTDDGVLFSVGGREYALHILGRLNAQNALPALALGEIFGISYEAMQKGLAGLHVIPGRMEEIKEGQNFRVFVDYAHEGKSMTALLEAARGIVAKTGGRVIVLLGAEGGGRDTAKRPTMGRLAGERADYVVVSNVDPYEDDPKEICEDIARAAETAGKRRGENLFVIEDRREGIRKVLSLARSGDAVFITGKGAEQSMVIKGKNIPWDDRVVVREELARF